MVKHLRLFQHWEVLPYTSKKHPHVRTYKVDGVSYLVKMRSSRFTLFKRSRTCVCCGLTGTIMGLDLCDGHKNPHFNLYAKRNGKLILFTRDHILPRSKGGEDGQKNYQTMCENCNKRKRDRVLTVEQLRAELFGKKKRGHSLTGKASGSQSEE